MEKIKVLLVEDEEVLAMVIKETLESRGFEISTAINGVEGWTKFNHYRPDICVLDIMLPRKDGLSLLSDIRLADQDMPVIMLTARVHTTDVLKGLEMGADDYMKKPFSMEELIFRINNLVRRAKKTTAQGDPALVNQIQVGDYKFNYTRLELVHPKKVFNLSQREADLMYLLLNHKNELLDKRVALIKIWGDDNIFNSRSMDVYITHLRKFLVFDAKVAIINVRGKGYKLVE